MQHAERKGAALVMAAVDYSIKSALKLFSLVSICNFLPSLVFKYGI